MTPAPVGLNVRCSQQVSESRTSLVFELTEGPDICNGGVAHDNAFDVGMSSIDGVYFASRRAQSIVLQRRDTAACQHCTKGEKDSDRCLESEGFAGLTTRGLVRVHRRTCQPDPLLHLHNLWNPPPPWSCCITTRRHSTPSGPLESIRIQSIPLLMMRKSLFIPRSTCRQPPLFSSEEDNDPLTDDGGSAIAIPVSLRANRGPNAAHTSKLASRARHQLASSVLSDDGTDSQTYDGDIESSMTVSVGQHQASKGFLYPNLHHTSSNSTLTSQIEDNAPSPSTSRHHTPPPTAQSVSDLEPTIDITCNPAAFTPEDIQAFVQRAINGEPDRPYRINPPPTGKPVRIFADGETSRDPVLPLTLRCASGVYDLFHFGYGSTRLTPRLFLTLNTLATLCNFGKQSCLSRTCTFWLA